MACTCIDQLRNRAERYSTGCDLFSAGDVCVFTLARNRARDRLAHPAVTFTPTDTTDYSTGNASVTLSVGDDTPTVTLALSASTLTHGGALTLTATVSSGGSAVTPGSVTFWDTAIRLALTRPSQAKPSSPAWAWPPSRLSRQSAPHTYKAVFAGNSPFLGSLGTQSWSQSPEPTPHRDHHHLLGAAPRPTTTACDRHGGFGREQDRCSQRRRRIRGHQQCELYRRLANVVLERPHRTFTAASSYSTIAVSRDVAVADFNGDGIPDMAVVDQSGKRYTSFWATGMGTFTAASGSPVTVSGSVLVGIAAGDFNDDGNVDLAVTDYYANKVFILLGNGNGTFQTPSSIGVVNEPRRLSPQTSTRMATSIWRWSRIRATRWRSAGQRQRRLPNHRYICHGKQPVFDCRGRLKQRRQHGPRGRQQRSQFGDRASWQRRRQLHAALGLALSGRRQLVARGSGDRGLQRRRKTRHRRSRFRKYRGINPAGQRRRNLCLAIHSQRPERSKTIATADFNGDGNLDLATCDTTTGTVDKFLGNGNGTFQRAVSSSTGSTACSSMAVASSTAMATRIW